MESLHSSLNSFPSSCGLFAEYYNAVNILAKDYEIIADVDLSHNKPDFSEDELKKEAIALSEGRKMVCEGMKQMVLLAEQVVRIKKTIDNLESQDFEKNDNPSSLKENSDQGDASLVGQKQESYQKHKNLDQEICLRSHIQNLKILRRDNVLQIKTIIKNEVFFKKLCEVNCYLEKIKKVESFVEQLFQDIGSALQENQTSLKQIPKQLDLMDKQIREKKEWILIMSQAGLKEEDLKLVKAELDSIGKKYKKIHLKMRALNNLGSDVVSLASIKDKFKTIHDSLEEFQLAERLNNVEDPGQDFVFID